MCRLILSTFLFLFCGAIVKADSLINIAIDFTVPPVLQSSSITEQFDASFEYDLSSGQIVPGTLVIDAAGPFGPFSSFFGSFSSDPEYPQINWYDSVGDFIQFDYGFDHNTPISVGVGGGQMFWACSSAPCVENFGGDGNADGSFVVTDIPEPATGVLTLTGVGLLGLLAVRRKRIAPGFPQAS